MAMLNFALGYQYIVLVNYIILQNAKMKYSIGKWMSPMQAPNNNRGLREFQGDHW